MERMKGSYNSFSDSNIIDSDEIDEDYEEKSNFNNIKENIL